MSRSRLASTTSAGSCHRAAGPSVRNGPCAARPACQQRRPAASAADARKCSGTPGGSADTQRVPVTPGILDGDPARLPGDRAAARARREASSVGQPCPGRRAGEPRLPPRAGVRRPRPSRGRPAAAAGRAGHRPTSLRGDLSRACSSSSTSSERLAIEELPQLLGTQEFAQQVAIEGQGLRATVQQRRVALVHVGGDVVEEERRGEGRGVRRLHADDADLAALDGRQDAAQGRQVEDVAEDLPIGLQDDGERAIATGHRQQLRARAGASARAACAGRGGVVAAAGHARRSRGSDSRRAPSRPRSPSPGPRLPPRRSARRPRPAPPSSAVWWAAGLQRRLPRRRPARASGIGRRQADDDAVIGPDGLHLHAERLAQPGLDGQRPGCVDAGAERRQQADAPVAQLVAEALQHDGAIGRQRTGGSLLLVEIAQHVRAGQLVEVMVLVRWRSAAALPREPLPARSHVSRVKAPMARPSSTGRPTPSPFQKGTLPGCPGAGVTSTRSCSMDSMRQALAPRSTTSPSRVS